MLEKSSKVHCLLLCETWLTEDTKKLLNFDKHKFIGREHNNKKGGGVGFLLRKNLIARERDDLSIDSACFEYHILKLKCRKRNILLVSLYCPPNSPVKSFHQEYKQLINKLSRIKSCDIIVGLDHNLDFLKANCHMDTQNFIEFNLESNLLPCITRPTCITKSTATLIDNTFISRNLQGKQYSQILITDISDHLPSMLTISGSFLDKKQTPTITSRK